MPTSPAAAIVITTASATAGAPVRCDDVPRRGVTKPSRPIANRIREAPVAVASALANPLTAAPRLITSPIHEPMYAWPRSPSGELDELERGHPGGARAEAPRLGEHAHEVEDAGADDGVSDRAGDVAARLVRLLAERGGALEAGERQERQHDPEAERGTRRPARKREDVGAVATDRPAPTRSRDARRSPPSAR